MYLGRAMACLRSKKLSTPALNATSLREVEELLQIAEIQKMVSLNFFIFRICLCFLFNFLLILLDTGPVVIKSS